MEEFEHLSDNPSVQLAYAQNAGFRANVRLFEQLTRHEGRFNRIAEKCPRELEAAIAERQERELATQKAAAAEAQAAKTPLQNKHSPPPESRDSTKQSHSASPETLRHGHAPFANRT